MAARTRRISLDDSWREKIQTSMLVNRLKENALGELEKELTPSQVRSIEILLKKTIPDLAAVEMDHSGDMGLTIKIVRHGTGTPEQLEPEKIPEQALDVP